MIPNMKKIKAVVYGRVSSDEQAKKEFSIPKIQIPECIKYIKEEGWIFVGSYVDEGLDCNSFEKRVELQRMINGDSDNYDVVVVWSYDRLTGDDENTRGMIYHILDKGKKQITSVRQKARIILPEEYDPKSLDVAQRRQITDIGVSFDRKIRRERFMESRTKTVASGRHISEAPYGYKLIRKVHPDDERRIIGYRVVNEEEAPILKRIFNEKVNGLSARKIAFSLNNDGIKARKGGAWTNARVFQTLKNPYPCGIIVWNKTNQRKFGDESILTYIPKEKWEYYPVNRKLEKYYKPIISKELFDKVQEILEQNKRLKGRASYSNNILAGLLRCPVCNRPMVETSYRKLVKLPFMKSYYLCSSNHNDGVCKNNKRICAQDLREEVEKEVIKFLDNPEERNEYQKEQKEVLVKDTQKRLSSYDRKLSKSQIRLRSLNIKFIDGKIKEDYYKEMLIGLEDEEEKLKKVIYNTKEELKEFEKEKETVIRLKIMGKDFRKRFKEMDIAKKKQIFQTLVREIKVEDGQLSIFYKV